MKAGVGFSGALSNKIPVDNGIKQGDLSTPTLFTIYFTIVFPVAFYENLDDIYFRYQTSGKVDNIHRLLAHTQRSPPL